MTINNPSSAFGYAFPFGGESEGLDCLAGGTIVKGNLVSVDVADIDGSVVAAPAAGLPSAIVGVALDAALTGQTVRVCTGGFCQALKETAGTVVAGEVLVRGTVAGQVDSQAAMSATIGANLGICLTSQGATAGLINVYFNQV